MNQRLLLIIYCVVALIISYIPVVGIPFNWLETIFHELSHALVTLLTGGAVVGFKLELNGAGMVLSRGGIGGLIAFAGYFGAAIWGFLLYQAGHRQRAIKITLSILVVALLAVLVLWVRDILTALIMLVVIALFLLMLKNSHGRYFNNIGQFTGVLVLFNAIKSPLYLIDGQNRGDGALLASLTLIPELVWVIIWLSCGIYLLYNMWQLTKSRSLNENVKF